jgi:hypothetical protein
MTGPGSGCEESIRCSSTLYRHPQLLATGGSRSGDEER